MNWLIWINLLKQISAGLQGGRAFFSAVREGDLVVFASNDDQDRSLWVQAMYRATGQSYKPVAPAQNQQNCRGGNAQKRCPCVLTQYVRCHTNMIPISVFCIVIFLISDHFFKSSNLNRQRQRAKRRWALFLPSSAVPSWMNFEIGGCGGQPSIHWAAAQTQSKQMSAGGLNNPNTAAEWKEKHLHNWNATVCSLSTNGEWAEWGLCHYRIWRSFLWAPGHSFNVKAKEHGLKLPFRFINLLIYIWNHYKASFLSTDGDCEDEKLAFMS